MRYTELNENSMQYLIDVNQQGGSAEGYVVDSDQENLVNWLSKHHVDDAALVSHIRSHCKRIAILNNINTDEEYRNQGIGSDLYYEFESDASLHGADAIILLADVQESQIEGFSLVKWYERLGYTAIADTGAGPLMLKQL